MSGRMGRANLTLYTDELERATGAIWAMLEQEGMCEAEQAFWTGAAMFGDALRTHSIEGDHQQFVAALKVHYTGELPA